jgi:hypothetical protein
MHALRRLFGAPRSRPREVRILRGSRSGAAGPHTAAVARGRPRREMKGFDVITRDEAGRTVAATCCTHTPGSARTTARG